MVFYIWLFSTILMILSLLGYWYFIYDEIVPETTWRIILFWSLAIGSSLQFLLASYSSGRLWSVQRTFGKD